MSSRTFLANLLCTLVLLRKAILRILIVVAYSPPNVGKQRPSQPSLLEETLQQETYDQV